MSATLTRHTRVVVLHGHLARRLAATRAGLDDLVLDAEAHAERMTPAGSTRAGRDSARLVALAGVQAALRRIERLREPVTVWLVHPDATTEQLEAYRARGFETP